ncbi:AoPex11B [Colletotrichum orchidophilum]|uniref:AoPex11B n=1 Tax=Colletotrichum orchidophilum TaxID=1209926 RepID=A0A1G4AQ68_9PEZI|nr:AoPex11B [Colletotrichum orchidophilum]OHE91317.1 AoPex11B [Colletotrichum orchidophilum]
MTSFTFDQFVAFGSDSAGLERILRGLQALTAIFSAYPSLVALALLDADPPILEALGPLRGHLTLTRRFIRFFWFLNSFGTSYNLYTSISSSPSSSGDGSAKRSSRGAGLETWLDIIKFTLLGLYGGLESLTLPDLLGVPQIAYFGAERTRSLNVEAQRFWFLALVFGVFANLTRILKAFAYAPVPQHGHGYGTGEKPVEEKSTVEGDVVTGEKVGGEDDGEEKLDWEAERARLRAIVMKRREGRKRWRREVAFKIKSLGRKIISDLLDCLIPGGILGWVNIQPGTGGIVMLITSVMTSRDIWERCGATVREKRSS